MDKSYNEVFEYYISILRLRIGQIKFSIILHEVYNSKYFELILKKYQESPKIPNVEFFILITGEDFTSNNPIKININGLYQILFLNRFNESINPNFELASEEEMIEYLNKLFQNTEKVNYALYSSQ